MRAFSDPTIRLLLDRPRNSGGIPRDLYDSLIRCGLYEIKGGATECERPKSLQNRPERMQQRREMMALAPRTDQRIPDCFRRSPITVRQPVSTTPAPTKNFFSRYSA